MLTETVQKEYFRLRDQIIESFYRHLNTEQREAVFTGNAPVLILAGAGTGKTTVLTHKLHFIMQFAHTYKSEQIPAGLTEDDLQLMESWLEEQESRKFRNLPPGVVRLISGGVRPYNILAVTFTNKAANEMKERVERLMGYNSEGLWIGTFHSICVRILRREIEKLGYKSNFVIYDSSDQQTVVKNILKELNIDSKQVKPSAVLAMISNAKNELIDPEEYGSTVGGYIETIVDKVYGQYQKMLKSSNALDFDDLIMLTVELLRKYPHVSEYYQDKFQQILVDEYQDTNHAQYVLVNLLAKKHRNICVVGDPDQSIYGFRGADIRNILSFEEDYPDARVVKLEQNYRSTERILDAAHYVIVKNVGRKDKRLRTDKGKGEYLNLFKANTDREEAQYVVSQVMELRRQHGYNYSDFAILYRINAQSRVFEDVLMRNRIPYKVFGGLKFYDRMEIKDTIAYLRLIYNPVDDVSFLRIVNKPRRGIGNTSLDHLAAYAERMGISLYEAAGRVKQISAIRGKATNSLLEFYRMIEVLRSLSENLTVTDLTKRMLEDTGYLKDLELAGTVEAQTRIENIQELFSAMEEYIRGSQGYTLASYLEEVALVSDLDSMDAAEDGVLLMTLHTVKGLEFPVVFLTGMEEMIFPHARSLEDYEELEEERRICYVGITRAKERLYLSHATTRLMFGQSKYNPVSRFVEDIPEELFGIVSELEREEITPVHKARKQLMQNEINRPEGAIDRFLQYTGGERVKHPTFGKGTVVGVKGTGEDQELDIVFPAVGLKKVLLQYAPIERIN